MRPKPIPKAQSALIVPLLSTTNGLAYHRRRKQQTALQRRLMSTAKQESSVCKGKAKAIAFFLRIRAVLALCKGIYASLELLFLLVQAKRKLPTVCEQKAYHQNPYISCAFWHKKTLPKPPPYFYICLGQAQSLGFQFN